MSEDFSPDNVYATVAKASRLGAAWLVIMWDGNGDDFAAFMTRRHAEAWLNYQRGSLPKPERTGRNQYYYEWADSV